MKQKDDLILKKRNLNALFVLLLLMSLGIIAQCREVEPSVSIRVAEIEPGMTAAEAVSCHPYLDPNAKMVSLHSPGRVFLRKGKVYSVSGNSLCLNGREYEEAEFLALLGAPTYQAPTWARYEVGKYALIIRPEDDCKYTLTWK